MPTFSHRPATLAASIGALVATIGGNAHAQHFQMPASVSSDSSMPVAHPSGLLPRATTSFGAVTEDGWIYMLGGYTGPPHDYYREAQCNDFLRVNVHDPSHIEYLPHDQKIQSCSLEAFDGRVFRIGGMIAHNSQDEPQALDSVDDVLAFDAEARAWYPMPSLPHRRSSHDSTMAGSRIVVAGGWGMDHEADDQIWHEDILVLDLEDLDGGWRSIPAPFKRRAVATTAIGDQVVTIGGITDDRKMSHSVDVLDLETQRWTSGPAYPGVAFGLAAETRNGRVVASGADGKVFDWAPGETSWRHVGSLTFPRFFHQIAVTPDDDLMFVGGMSRGVRPAHLEHLDLDDDRSATTVRHLTIPTPIASKNRQGMFVHDGWLYLFGGNNSTGQHDFEPENFLEESHRLSLANLEWEAFEPFPHQRQTIQTATAESTGAMYALGGFGHDGEVARTWPEGYRYDRERDEWMDDAPNLPIPRSQFGFTEHDGTLWVFGGLDYDPRREKDDRFRHVTEVVSASIDRGDEEFAYEGINLTEPRRAFGGAVLDGGYFMVGGMRENFQLVESAERFDFETGQFTTISSPARPRLSGRLVPLNGRLYFAGGSSPAADGGFEPNPSLEVYDPATDRWSTVMETIPVTPTHLRMMPYRGRILLFSSHVDEGGKVELVFVDPGTPRPATTGVVATEIDDDE
ncbi:MAG: hypothetical protein CBB69_003510 [Phycisphaera sp. TMED9]|nr:MAG: hypothetical protein CBB69_003510 [Phycisphaera sp. TMED9]